MIISTTFLVYLCFHLKDVAGAGWPCGLGSRSPILRSCRLRVRFPSLSGHATLSSTGTSVNANVQMYM